MIRSLCIILAGAVLLLFSCVTRSGPEENPKPAWLIQPPISDLYFIGIGGSNTEDPGEAREIARNRAIAEIASQIAVEISSQLILREREEQGDLTRVYEERLRSSTKENLTELEIVGQWHSDTEGSWIYLRMNKAAWQRSQAERTGRIEVNAAAIPESQQGRVEKLMESRLVELYRDYDFVRSGEAKTLFKVDLLFRRAPDNEYGIIFVYLRSVVTLERDGRVLETRESEEVKGNGLDEAQALADAVDKLLLPEEP